MRKLPNTKKPKELEHATHSVPPYECATLLNQYIHNNIPISKALGAMITTASQDKVIVSAPFINNINHKSTVFGGSLHAVLTLSCWALLYTNCIDYLDLIDIVIVKSDIRYLKPVTQDFSAVCEKPAPDEWAKFEKFLYRKGKGRLEIKAFIEQDNEVAVEYVGVFAVIKRDADNIIKK